MRVSNIKTARSRAESPEARLRTMIDSLPQSFVLWDADGRLVLHNQKFAEFYQIDADVLKPGLDLEQVARAAAVPSEAINPSGSTEGKGTLQYVGHRWIYVSSRPTPDGGRVSVGTDVTLLKDKERELQTSKEQLEKDIERLESSQRKLQEEADERAKLAFEYATEKEHAEEASRLKTEFLANMSHELRTPLNAIMGFAQIMEKGMFGPLGDERYVGYAKDILDSGQHLIDLIDDILDVSKIESGKTELNPASYTLDDIVQDCIRIIEPGVFDAGLHLRNHVRGNAPVLVDKRATKQILLNLLTNAVKFTPRGGTVTVRDETRETYVTLAVEDSGTGISEQDLSRIGKPFEQIEHRQNKTHKGTGLGLALSKSLVELQGGELRIESEPGKGTTVTVTLLRADTPLKQVNERQEVRA